jgi:hypothetical protein
MTTRSVVYKYTLGPGEQVFRLPVGAQPVHVREQHGAVVVWAVVDPDVEGVEQHRFLVTATGESFERGQAQYLGTAHLLSGQLVFHVFHEVVG